MSLFNAINNTPSEPRTPSQAACLPCRSVKVKCRSDPPNQVCERCHRKSLNCVFEQHRRGRKLGTRLKKNYQKSGSAPSGDTSVRTVEEQGSRSMPERLELQNHGSSSIAAAAAHDRNHGSSSSHNETWSAPEGLQPAGLLSKEAQTGRFSLQNILCVPDVLRPNPDPMLEAGSRATLDNRDDPIGCNILTFPVALGLLDSFMRCLNPYISQLDPKLHTFEYVQQKSSLLLTSILTASSKAFHPSLHPKLREHTEKLLGKAFTQGVKSTETVQAILIMTYWKDPDEIRTWMLVGYAIRMCIELGWHELEPICQTPRSSNEEMSVREARNIERTWLVLYVYDRSLSLQLGKPWMIEQNDFITKADKWHLEEFAVAGGDLLLSSFVGLRIISAEMTELASPSRSVLRGPRAELLSKILNNGISTWERMWLPLFDRGNVAPCQKFLVHFYSLHLRLLLNSYSLQTSLKDVKKGVPISKSALWLCSSSAMGMLEQISHDFGPLKLLYFAQDSIHVMTAYAAIFLIKLLVFLPSNLRSDFEAHSVQSILSAADTFEQQCATEMTGCAMQARFLKNVVEKYQSMKSQSTTTTADTHPPHRSASQGTLVRDNRRVSAVTESSLHTDNQAVGNPTHNPDTNMDQSVESDMPAENQADFGTDLFADKDVWETLFADAGFWMAEGMFLPDNGNTAI